MRAFLQSHGLDLYQDIRMDQPPMLPKLLYIAFAWLGPSVGVARALVLAIVSLMVGSIFYIIYKTQSLFSALLTVLLICCIPDFIQLSVSAMNGLPAIAFAIISCLGIYFYEKHRMYRFLFISALLLVIGLQTKFLVSVFIPAVAVELFYIEYKHCAGKIKPDCFRPALFWLACLLFIFLGASLLMAVDYAQIFAPYSLGKQAFVEEPFAAVFEWISTSHEIALLSIGSLLWFRKRSMRLFYIPLITTACSFVVFSHHVPTWSHHRLILMIPAAWLASFGIHEFFSPTNWKGLKNEKRMRRYWTIFKLAAIGVPLIIFCLHLQTNVRTVTHSLKKRMGPQTREVIRLINENKTAASVLVTDTPSFAFHTQVAIPPALSTISLKQIQTGLITEESIVEIIEQTRADMILWSRFPQLGESIMQRVGEPYELAYQSGRNQTKLYIRKNPAADSPPFKGFGGNTVGGRGGEVYTVENLNAAGPGSLREAIQQSGPRVIRFSVPGTIHLSKPLIVKNQYLTIDGSSAPAPGITLSGGGIVIEASEVIVTHLKIRVGDDPQGPDPEDRDGITIHIPSNSTQSVENIVIDHCSISWAVDENIGTWIDGDAELKNITISHNIISEGLKFSIHPEGRHSMGVLIGDNTRNVTVFGNLFAHNFGRNPQLKGGTTAEIISNIMYNPGDPAIGLSNSKPARPIRAQIANNYFVPGKNTKHPEKHISINSNVLKSSELFIEHNHGPGTDPNDKWRIVFYKSKRDPEDISKMKSEIPLWTIPPSTLTFEQILNQAGAFPDQRDTIDQRIISDVKNGTGKQINTPNASTEPPPESVQEMRR